MGRFEGKTEKATPQRRQQARRDGHIARSADVGAALGMAGAVVALRVFAPATVEVAQRETARLLSLAGAAATAGGASMLSSGVVGGSALRMAAGVAAPFLVVAVLTAVASGLLQTGFRIAPKAAAPKLSHLSPKRGLQRLKPATAGWELAKSLLKLGLLAALLWPPLQAWSQRAGRDRNLDAGLARTLAETHGMLLRAVALLLIVAAADYAWSRRRTARELRMSKDEVKREAKNTEGDPLVRSQRRRRAAELSRNRMLGAVGQADVVVTNPTHLAVALRYADGDPAPRVVAKGADRLAAKIRAEAHRNGVVVTENKPLARALYRRCKLGAHVPAALYEAVAIVLALAYRRYNRVAA